MHEVYKVYKVIKCIKCIESWGVSPSPTGKSFRFVRACVRAVWLPSGIGSKCVLAGLFPFPFWPG